MAPTRAGAARPVSTSAADEAATLHNLAETVDRALDLLVGVLDELGDQLAGLAAGRVVLQRHLDVGAAAADCASTYSMTRSCMTASEPLSKTATMLGWLRQAAARASCVNQATKAGSCAYG